MEEILTVAINFRARIDNNSKNKVSISLFGGFDGTSACQLADVMEEKIENATHIHIHTDGLKHIDNFGLNVFIARIRKFHKQLINIEFTGRYKKNFKDRKNFARDSKQAYLRIPDKVGRPFPEMTSGGDSD
jgi:stage II sporulation protein AA (anti-sigma F factor antagonist)